MKNKALLAVVAGMFLVACNNSEVTEPPTSSETTLSSEVTSEAAPIWTSMEEAIVFYEEAIIQDLGEDLASIELDGEFYERESWELIENTGDTIVLSYKNVGYGGRNPVAFVKEEEFTTITFYEVDTPYPEKPISKRTVQNADLVTVSKEDLKPVENENSSADEDLLSGYSVQEIEYARVWLEVIGNVDVEELNVTYISKGEPINAYEPADSATYPENVVVLTGKIMADGSVIYSSNGDGSINLYQVPSHWQQGVVPEEKTMLEYTTDIANNPVLVPISTGNDQDVATLIEKQNVSGL